MQIIDAQIHLWSKGTVVPPHRTRPYLLDEALRDMDAAGVDGAVIHPPSWDPDSNGLALAAASLHPQRFAILGRIPLVEPEKRGQIESWRNQPGMLGLRYTFLQPHMKSWPSDGTMDWLWPAAERAGIPVALLATDFLPLVGEIAQRHPGLRLLVDQIRPREMGRQSRALAPQVDLSIHDQHDVSSLCSSIAISISCEFRTRNPTKKTRAPARVLSILSRDGSMTSAGR